MKKFYKVIVVLSGLFYAANIFAQAASVTWALDNTTQLTSVSSGNVTGSAESKNSGSGQFGMSVFDYSTDGQRLWEGTAGWIAGSEESNRYIQFDALFTTGNSFTVTNVSFNYGAAGINGHIESNAYYSTDGWQTRTQLNSGPLAYPNPTMLQFSQNVNVAIAGGTTFSLRIYPYAILNNIPGSPTFAVHNNVVISGTIAAKKNCMIQISDLVGKWGRQILLRGTLQVLGTPSETYLPNKDLTFYIDDIIVGKAATNTSGVASLMYTIPQDSITSSMAAPQDSVTRSFTVSFAGDANYNAQSGTGKLIVVRHVTSVTVPPSIYVRGAQPVIVGNLTDNDNDGKGVSNKVLEFHIIEILGNQSPEIKIGSATTNANGVASISYAVPQDSVTRLIKISFAGDANYSKQSGTGTLKKMTAIQITNAAGKWNNSVLLTAKLQESGLISNTNLPSQALKFYQDSVYINSATTNESGVASLMYTIPQDSATSSFSAPQDSVTRSIRVEFAGDANYGMQSGTGKLTVAKHVTSVAVTPLITVYGQPVVLVATLTDNDNNKSGIPNQVLKFTIVEGTGAQSRVITVGSATTNASGVATLSYSLPQDSVARSITATYVGDANYSAQSGTGKLTYTPTGVENTLIGIPTKFDLSQNYPNPFNPTSTIRYDIPKTSLVKISVYNILGKEIKVLVNEEKNPGNYEIIFDAKNLASGIYFYTIRTENFTQSKKMILMK